jgi:hypothetical protein
MDVPHQPAVQFAQLVQPRLASDPLRQFDLAFLAWISISRPARSFKAGAAFGSLNVWMIHRSETLYFPFSQPFSRWALTPSQRAKSASVLSPIADLVACKMCLSSISAVDLVPFIGSLLVSSRLKIRLFA